MLMKFENLAAIRKYSGSNTARKNTDKFAFPFFTKIGNNPKFIMILLRLY